MRIDLVAVVVSIAVAHGMARAEDAPKSVDPTTPATAPGAASTAPGDSSEVIEVTGAAPARPGTIKIDATTARRAPGALGEPLRVLGLLPGVATSYAASGYPVIRGTLPGESRFTFDDIELPLLYHFALGNEVLHPSFIGEVELRAGGYGAEQGQLLGGLVTLTPATPDATRTELRANPVEIGAYHHQVLSKTASVTAAARVGTLSLVKIFKTDRDLYYVDQQTRFVHRFGNGDQLALTSLGAIDYYGRPEYFVKLQADRLAFHRLDVRWTRARNGWMLRAGVQTELDKLRSTTIYLPLEVPPGVDPPMMPPHHEGGESYGARAYADASVSLAPWLRVRGGFAARHRTLVDTQSPFNLPEQQDPYLGLARAVDVAGAWAAFDLRIGPLTITPGIRGDAYYAYLVRASTRHVTVDPRLAVTADLPDHARAEVAVGAYSAPPQLSLFRRDAVIGPLPLTDGIGSNAGMSRAIQTEASLRTPLGAGIEGNFAVYYNQTRRAVDFAVVGQTFHQPDSGFDFVAPYRNVDTRAFGAEVMLRRELARSVTGWLSYSLAKLDRDFGFVNLPGDYDQRHTLNATAQWKRGSWLFGGTLHFNTGRPVQYPQDVGFGGFAKNLDRIHRLPINARLDVRAERFFQFASWRMSAYFSMQNATFSKEVVGYDAQPGTGIVEQTVFLPLAVLGLEVVL
jgi:hypothetical protein